MRSEGLEISSGIECPNKYPPNGFGKLLRVIGWLGLGRFFG